MELAINRKKIHKKSYKNLFINVATFLIIFLGASCVVVDDILPSFLTIAIWLVLFICLLLKTKTINIRTLIFFLTIICLMWISVLVNHESVVNCAKHTFSFLVVFLYVNLFPLQDAKESITKVMLFIALISLVFFPLYIIFPSMNNLFQTNVNGHSYSILLLYVQTIGMKRNCGLFWEPGAFQAFLNLALLIELSREKINIRNVIVFCLTILTTLSTSGFIAAFFIFCYFFLNKHKSKRKIYLFFLLSASVAIFLLLFKDSFIEGQENDLFGKIVHFFKEADYEYVYGKNLTTSAIRYFSIIKPLEVFVHNPLTGVGYDGLRFATLQYTRGVISCTFVNWFAIYGVLFGAIMMLGYVLMSKKVDEPFFARLFIFLSLMAIIMSEDYTHNAFFYAIPCYGFLKNTKRNSIAGYLRGHINEKQVVVLE